MFWSILWHIRCLVSIYWFSSRSCRLVSQCTRHFGSIAANSVQRLEVDELPMLLIISRNRSTDEVVQAIKGCNFWAHSSLPCDTIFECVMLCFKETSPSKISYLSWCRVSKCSRCNKRVICWRRYDVTQSHQSFPSLDHSCEVWLWRVCLVTGATRGARTHHSGAGRGIRRVSAGWPRQVARAPSGRGSAAQHWEAGDGRAHSIGGREEAGREGESGE